MVPVVILAGNLYVCELSLEPQMVFLWWRHTGADYRIQYLCADVATLRHALIKKPLAAVARSRAFDNTVCLFM